ncbi:unnamed protein product [Moneuplotes crassus]|uniref:Uncharacterized protein n=1 Tax=Euplotes crassus TaxID=5936 RepID=A0AAD2D9J8_EUPCR|nr:unnamed protein product [Moneuplotes crassus]
MTCILAIIGTTCTGIEYNLNERVSPRKIILYSILGVILFLFVLTLVIFVIIWKRRFRSNVDTSNLVSGGNPVIQNPSRSSEAL